MIEIQQAQTLDQLEILHYMYSKHLVSPSNTIRALKNAGIDVQNIKVEDLTPYDQDHFGGVNATEECLKLLSIDASSNVLDIGSGLGGPARYIAHRTGARVTGIEIQRDRFEAAQRFTRLVSLEHLVSFRNEDFASLELQGVVYSHVVSFLSILHMIDKRRALKALGRALQDGGSVFIEDYYRKGRLSSADKTELLKTISCPSLISVNNYLKTLEEGGIRIKEMTDTTDRWKKVVEERVEGYNTGLVTLSKQFGLEAALNAATFAEGVMRIFHKGMIGGFRIIGRKEIT